MREVGRLAEVRAVVRSLDSVGIASAAAALQLLPENGNSIWRLEVVAALASEEGSTDDPLPLTVEIVDRLVNSGQLASLASAQEDPMDDLLCEEMTFHGGSFLVGGGLAEVSTFVFRALARGVLLSGELSTDLTGELAACAVSALKLSDAVLRGAGLSRNIEPGSPRGSVTIPDAESLGALQRLTAFDQTRLASLLNRKQIEALEPLIEDVRRKPFSDEDIMRGGAWRPFLRVGDWLVLHRPFDVLNALRHHFSVRVSEVCGSEVAALAFSHALESDVAMAFAKMALHERVIGRRDADTPFTEIRVRCDSDKEIVALLLSDDFLGIEEDDPFTMWNGHEQIELAKTRVEEIAAERASAHDQLLGLILMQPAGRTAMMLSPATDIQGVSFEVLTAADLDTIGTLESGDRLALWKFADASDELTSKTRLNLSSSLDLYATYRDEERTFAPYMDATFLTIAPGGGGSYRREARAGRDRHGEPHPNYSIREVEREVAKNPLDRRIYHESPISDARPNLLVAGAPLALWVAGPDRDVLASWDGVDTVAYWLGELTTHLTPSLERLSRHRSSILVEVDFSPWGFWFEEPDNDPGGDDTFKVELVHPDMVLIDLGTEVRRQFLGADNAGDRLVVDALIGAITRLLTSFGEKGPTPDERRELLEAVAPLGVKKHLISLPIDANPMMEPIKGRPRQRQEADTTAAEVDLGRHLVDTFGYRGEPVPKERRNDVLKAAVAFLFERSKEAFDGVDPQLLLEELVYANELLLSSSQHSLAILPAKLATYPSASSTLRDEVSEANLAGICCRFLIEYAAACPPSGDAPWSVARYDDALASVAELLKWADLSDAVRGKLTDVDLLIRDDARLRLLEADRFDAGRGEFFLQHIDQQRQQASDEWDSHFTESEPAESDIVDRLNELMIEETGVSLIELGDVLVAANLVARERGEEVMALPYAEAIQVLADRVERDIDSVAPGVDYLSMGHREAFLNPPTGRTSDTYPWLFSRRWSFNRRPFLRRHGDSEDALVWGRRHVLQAMQIMFGQLGAGQYQALAETEPLRRELGRIAKEEGAKFEEEVQDVIRAAGWEAHRRVRRVDGDHMQRSDGETLGDIDVLAGSETSPILWAVECKSLNGSLSSAEVAREMTDHFRPEGKSSVAKHAERVAWMQERGVAAARLLGLSERADREVRGLIVTGREVVAPFIDEIPFEVVSVKQLPDLLGAAQRERASP
jgi:hypothetical protein